MNRRGVTGTRWPNFAESCYNSAMSFSFLTKSPSRSSKKHGKERELSLVIDVESGLVRGSLVLFSGGSSAAVAPHIFHRASAEIMPRGNGDETKGGVRLLSAMLDAVSVVSEKTVTGGLKIASANSLNIPISKIHVVFSSPWIISKTKTVKVSYEKETEITKTAVNAILDGERRDLEQKFLAEHDSSLEFDLAFIEQKIFEVKLNGYPTVRFEGKKARELEVSFAVSISSKSILSHIEKTLEKSIRMSERNIECHSSLLLQYSALRTIVAGGSDYIAIHVHREISDIIVVKDGLCAAMASFPAGTALLSRKLTYSSLNLQSQNALHPAENSRVAAIADSSTNTWAEQLTDTLAALGQMNSMPHRIYLLANGHYSHFERALAEISGEHVTVSPIEKSALDSKVSHEDKEQEDSLMSLYVFALQQNLG